MKKNTIIGLGALCFVVVFALIIIGVNSIQQELSGIESEKTPEIEFKESSEDLKNIPPKDITPSKVLPVKQSGSSR